MMNKLVMLLLLMGASLPVTAMAHNGNIDKIPMQNHTHATVVDELKLSENSVSASVTSPALETTATVNKVCQAQVSFTNKVQKKQQEVSLSADMSVSMSQFLSVQSRMYGNKVASNVICQQLVGGRYTGSSQEWSQFMESGITGLQKSSGTKIRVVDVGDEEKHFHQAIDHREYTFYGTFKGSKQVIYNVAILDKLNNTLYTLSVSGAEQLHSDILNEFKRLIKSFKLNNTSA
jgi:hypothetical protein